MLAQTNLQLYGQMLAAGWADESLTRARSAYDLARSLFGDAFRPSHKPFVCHLVGTASAALRWNAAEPVVLAGLVHSAYLFGDFGDGDRGPTPRRRRYLVETIGTTAEALVFHYSEGSNPADDVQILRLADRFDELADGGPRVARCKAVEGVGNQQEARQQCLDDATKLVGTRAAEEFREAFSVLDAMAIPSGLLTQDRAFHRIQPGQLSISRGVVGRRWAGVKRSLAKRWSA